MKELAASDDPVARAAAALVEAGFAADTELDDLTAGSVTRTLAEIFAQELVEVYERLGETYESAFVETATESLELLVDGLARLAHDCD